MTRSRRNSDEATIMNKCRHWLREYQLFLATVALLVGAHFIGEAIEAIWTIVVAANSAGRPGALQVIDTGVVAAAPNWIGAAVGLISCWYMVSVLKPHRYWDMKPTSFDEEENRRPLPLTERLLDFPTSGPRVTVFFSVCFLILVDFSIHFLDSLLHAELNWHWISLPLLLVATIWFARSAHLLDFVDIELEDPKGSPRKFLVLFLSETKSPVPTGRGGQSLLKYKKLSDDYQALEKNLSESERWNWEPCLRGIEIHAGTLERLYVIASKASISQVDAFCAHIRAYQASGVLRRELKIYPVDHARKSLQPIEDEGGGRTHGAGIDFEDYMQIKQAIRHAVDHAGDEGETVIDITGGQKPNSLVGGIMTLDRDLLVQYVQTGNDKKPRFYRIVKKPNLPA